MVIFGCFVLLAVIGPWIAPEDPSKTGGPVLQSPSAQHLLGTTQSGQDILSQILVGARTSMLVGLVAATFATAPRRPHRRDRRLRGRLDGRHPVHAHQHLPW
ncbi:hypothetical protein ACU686_01090 [Yinghuangia aomiensis]